MHSLSMRLDHKVPDPPNPLGTPAPNFSELAEEGTLGGVFLEDCGFICVDSGKVIVPSPQYWA